MQTEHAPHPGFRGRPDHEVREQIIKAAGSHFSHYGFEKTSVSDLAKAIGFSKAYIYKFFVSKQAIGEAICSSCLDRIYQSAIDAVAEATSSTEKFRRIVRSISESGAALFFEDRKLYDIAARSALERWQSNHWFEERILRLVEDVVREGRENGEFERKTPLDETCRAILQVIQPFMNPLILQHNLDRLPDAPNEVISLVLRSLAP